MASDAIHDMPHPGAAVKGIYACLKPGAVFSMIDVKGHTAHVCQLMGGV